VDAVNVNDTPSPNLHARLREAADAVRAAASVAVPKQSDVHLGWGVVEAINTGPNSVDIVPGNNADGVSKWTTVEYEGWYQPTIGDNVAVLFDGTDRIVIGTMGVGGGASPSVFINVDGLADVPSSTVLRQVDFNDWRSYDPVNGLGGFDIITAMVPVTVIPGGAIVSATPSVNASNIDETHHQFALFCGIRVANLDGTETITAEWFQTSAGGGTGNSFSIDFTVAPTITNTGSDLLWTTGGGPLYSLAGGSFYVTIAVGAHYV
jgi:hypothetical protein